MECQSMYTEAASEPAGRMSRKRYLSMLLHIKLGVPQAMLTLATSGKLDVESPAISYLHSYHVTVPNAVTLSCAQPNAPPLPVSIANYVRDLEALTVYVETAWRRLPTIWLSLFTMICTLVHDSNDTGWAGTACPISAPSVCRLANVLATMIHERGSEWVDPRETGGSVSTEDELAEYAASLCKGCLLLTLHCHGHSALSPSRRP